MSDEVRNAASIGAAVNNSMGSLPERNKKAKAKGRSRGNGKEDNNTSEDTAPETKPEAPTKPASSASSGDTTFGQIRELFRLKPQTKITPTATPAPTSSPKGKKTGKDATIKDVKSAMSAGYIDKEQAVNLSRGYANQFAKKEVGRQFQGYEPPVDLTKL
jgi:hypothetical protein